MGTDNLQDTQSHASDAVNGLAIHLRRLCALVVPLSIKPSTSLHAELSVHPIYCPNGLFVTYSLPFNPKLRRSLKASNLLIVFGIDVRQDVIRSLLLYFSARIC